ncbi:hypothetical protein [Rhodanobacter sp. DHG33]|uniref:hypothetical protein n=1 Tax=Rhodanobacter sp. DHG33 TaxID=2775921 RepID=UPI0017861647|nr:hypothetical protein [Rhodanobacter sp. DHG33]MBD8899969.1 hypothetical protein [Rhodanobacter sp. DHG33]
MSIVIKHPSQEMNLNGYAQAFALAFHESSEHRSTVHAVGQLAIPPLSGDSVRIPKSIRRVTARFGNSQLLSDRLHTRAVRMSGRREYAVSLIRVASCRDQ